ncbi:MAG: pectin esterase [Cyclobacteriaceae bacterium]
MKWTLTFSFLISCSFYLRGQDADFIVAKDGAGDFTTVQAAIDAVPHLRKERTFILIKKGTYRERLLLPTTKQKVSFVGEDRDETILVFGDYASKLNRFGEPMGTSGSSSFYVFGDEFHASNITFQNDAGPVGQAVAVRVDGDKVKFENCRFLGNQDTLYPHGKSSRQYYKNCYIEGTVDFIFGWSTALFEDCEIFCKSKGYITAASTEQSSSYGFVFKHCRITGNAPDGSVYLGRPWRDYARTVFIDCDLSEVIHPAGWHNWNNPVKEQTAFYAEYNSSGPGGDSTQRVNWSQSLNSVEDYTIDKIFGDWQIE